MNKTLTILIVIIILIVVAALIYFYIPKNMNTTPPLIQTMKIEILQEGTGDAAKSGDLITVNYVGTLQDGTKFDSSIGRGQPFTFTLGQNSVIQGWELGVAGMKIGEKRKLTIPPELAYGEQGAGGVIPPNATLTFEIDLLGISQ